MAQAEEPQAPVAIGALTVGETDDPGVSAFRRVVAAGLRWLCGTRPDDIDAAGDVLAGHDPATWSVGVSDAGFVLADSGSPEWVASVFPFDLSVDCNALREASPQPFSRTVRGRVLDALFIDNARKARLSVVPSEDDGEPGTHRLVLFAQSRGRKPGAWEAVPLAGLALAPSRHEPPEPGHPVELDFGEHRHAVLRAMTDLVLATDESSTAISTAERFEAFGELRTSAVMRLARAIDGRAWCWLTEGQEAGLTAAFPLARGAADRDVAAALGLLFQRRIAWAREPSGRVTATFACKRDNAPAEESDPTLSMRFIEIAGRTTLVVSTEAAALDHAAEALAEIPPPPPATRQSR